MIYLSSANYDTDMERCVINEGVKRQLHQFCAERKLDLEIVDLNHVSVEFKSLVGDTDSNWFLSDDDHSMTRLKTALVKRCVAESVGPCFIVSLFKTTRLICNITI